MLVKHDTDCELGLNGERVNGLHSWQQGSWMCHVRHVCHVCH